MKIKYIAAIGALGSTLAIVPPCTAVVMSSPTTVVGPASAVWDGSDYVGQMGGKYYYLGPNNTWIPLDRTRQQHFEQWLGNNPNAAQQSQMQNTRSQGAVREQNPSGNNPNGQPNQTGNTRSQGSAMAQNPTRQPSQMGTTRLHANESSWTDPSAQIQIRNTRYQGHDMGQTRTPAPPLEQTQLP